MKATRIARFLVFALAALPAVWGQAPEMAKGSGLTVMSQQTLDNRLFQVQVSTAALPGPAGVSILLPADYNSNPGAKYPVLYLFHGSEQDYTDWTAEGNAEPATAGLELIVVMPDIGLNDDTGGFCANWEDGSQNWETFEIDQLIPWIDSNLRTAPVRSQRAIAGLSEGGLCSTELAARHPDLFASVGSFSGAPDLTYGVVPPTLVNALLNVFAATQTATADSIYGDQITNELNWTAHDPTLLASNLGNTNIYQFFGNGLPGPLDPIDPTNIDDDGSIVLWGALEAVIYQDNIPFHNQLSALNIPSYYDSYGPGTHTWPYWDRDLTEMLPMLMQNFAYPATPSSISYMSADNGYSVWGWNVQMDRTAAEFSTLSEASCHGFTLSGSGSAVVTTPPCYVPGNSYEVTVTGSQVGSSTTIAAQANGTLMIQVPLGPANPFQEYTVLAALAGTQVYTTGVTSAGKLKGWSSAQVATKARAEVAL